MPEWNGRFQEWNGKKSFTISYQFHRTFTQKYKWIVITELYSLKCLAANHNMSTEYFGRVHCANSVGIAS